MKFRLITISVLALLLGCGPAAIEEAEDSLSQEELFLVEQYLRVAEARSLSVEGSTDADTLYAVLATEIPLDSIMSLSARISEERPERWRAIFREIEKRMEP